MSGAHDVLEFWFGAPGSDECGKAREFWFRKSDATDALIRERFGVLVEEALATPLPSELSTWIGEPRSALALILLLDQFTRNVFRDTPRAFAGDERALAAAKWLVSSGLHAALTPIERWFVYMPFEHSEALPDQQQSLQLFQALADLGLSDLLPWARKHHEVVARFGRFPHRNAILGRTSTPDEVQFLQQPGARF
jgi:uncharacterized protein (DUF924 family)